MNGWPRKLGEAEVVGAQKKAERAVTMILGNAGRNDVRDVLQDAAVKAALKFRQFNGDAQFSSWFVRIAINEAIMWLRHRFGNSRLRCFVPVDAVGDRPSFEKSPEDLAFESEVWNAVLEEVARLSNKRREAFFSFMAERKVTDDPAAKIARHWMKRRVAEGLAERGMLKCCA